MAINFGLLNTQAPAEIGASIGNALAMRRQRDMQDEQAAQRREQFQVQNALANMQLQKAQQESQDQSNFRNALGGLQPGAETASPEMYRASPSLAMAFEKQRFEQRKGKSEMEKSQTETALKRAELSDRIAGEVYADPRREKFVWAIQQRAAMGESPETLRYLSEKLNATPDEELPNMAAQYLKATKEGMQAEVARLNPKPATPSDLSRLIAERDALPQGDPRRATYDAAISKSTTHAPQVSVSYGSPVAAVDAQGNPVFIQPNKNGGAPSVIPGVKPPENGRAPTEFESKSAFYASNMKNASKTLADLEAQGLNMAQMGSQVDTALAGGVTNIAASPLAQQARQAQNQWAEQMLRMQTGAAATENEIKRTVATYFPVPGDSKQVVAQKRAARQQAEQGVFSASGRAQGRVETPANPAPAAPSKQEFDSMPNPAQYAGKVVTDTETGLRYRSNGKQWMKE